MTNKQLFKLWEKLHKLDEWKATWLNWHRGDSKRDDGVSAHPKDVIRYDNIPYGDNPKYDQLDVYRPRKCQDRVLPLVIDMHGGGFAYGYRNTYQYYCLHVAQAGYAVVNYGYRMAPIYPFPGAWHDTLKVVNWCVKNAKKYKFDLNHVIIIGDSAGANLVEEFLVLYNNSWAAKKFGFKKPPMRVVASSWNCGVYFLDRIPNPSANPVRDMMNLYYTRSVRRKYRDFLHIEKYIRKPFTPIFIATANQDVMHDQNIRMDQLLTDRGIPHRFKVYGDANHVRQHDFQMNQKDMSVSQRCYDDEMAFYKRLLKNS